MKEKVCHSCYTSKYMHITLEYPFILILLLLNVCFFTCKRTSLTLYFSKVDFLPSVSFSTKSVLLMLTYSLFILALSSPFSYTQKDMSYKKGRDLVLAIDASGSMGASMKNSNKNRFETLIDVANVFLEKRYDDNVGVVVFGSFAYTASPITYDLKALRFIMAYLDIGVAGDNTAVGEAIYQSLRALKASDAKEKVIILLTDGFHNSGSISPHDGVAMAKEAGVKIYSIGIGGEFDTRLLQTIAEQTKARTFSVNDTEDLENVFSELDRLEPSRLRASIYQDKKPLFVYPLLLALLFFTLLLGRRV